MAIRQTRGGCDGAAAFVFECGFEHFDAFAGAYECRARAEHGARDRAEEFDVHARDAHVGSGVRAFDCVDEECGWGAAVLESVVPGAFGRAGCGVAIVAEWFVVAFEAQRGHR
jgi:hypothetical protein